MQNLTQNKFWYERAEDMKYILKHNSDVKSLNTLGYLDQYMCRGLRLWNSRDHELV